MKNAVKQSYLMLTLAFLFSFLIVKAPIFADFPNEQVSTANNSSLITVAPVEPLSAVSRPVAVDIDGQTVIFELEEFLIGVVAAEMPADYPAEALKAQAVAARSYILYRENALNSLHPGAAVCVDPAHCFAWLDEEALREKWGTGYEESFSRVKSAVDATAGEYLSYAGSPINAVFHAVSGGMTESAADVWSADIPYLQAVESAGETSAAGFLTETEVSADALRAELLSRYPEAELPAEPAEWFSDITRSGSGGVISVAVGNLRLHGNEIRSLCSLRSSNFTVEYRDSTFYFTTRGYGHGVGMSQYGAHVLADEGLDYKRILTWYYTGVTLEH